MEISWIILIVILLVTEIHTTALYAVWGIPAALLALGLEHYHFSELTQAMAFVVVTLLLVVITYPLSSKIRRKTHKLQTNIDAITGKPATVIEKIDQNSKGKVSLNGAIWTATSLTDSELLEGTVVEVTEMIGNSLVVKRKEEL